MMESEEAGACIASLDSGGQQKNAGIPILA